AQRRSAVETGHAVDQRPQVLRTGADMVRNRKTGVSIVFADESAFFPKAQPHKPRIADDDRLQAQQFVQLDGPPPRLAYRAPPTLDAVMRRALSFDRIARSGVLQQQKRGGPG